MFTKVFRKYILLSIIFFTWIHFTSASFEITEIMYDLDGTDTNREWVEVKNTGGSPDDLSKWYLFSDNTKHALVPQGAPMVPAGGYAVIAQNVTSFKSDWPNFGGLLFDSSWTGFNNDGEEIGLKDPDLNLVSPVSFTSSTGAAGNGDSLQKINNSWSGALPTPGIENQAGSGGGGGESENTETTTSGEKPPVKKKEIEIPKITTNIIVKNTVVAGLPFTIDATTFGYGKEPLRMGKFVWNFGDGKTKEEYEHFPFTYTYEYSGEYLLTLSYYRVSNSKTVEATDRIIIKVIPSEVSISSVGNEVDPFIELENKSNIEVDISGWHIQGATRSFYIPTGTFILPNKKLKFSGTVMGFTGRDVKQVVLYNMAGEALANYPEVKSTKYTYSKSASYEPEAKSRDSIDESSVINLDNLQASAIGAKLPISTNMLAWIGLVGIILIACLLVFIINRKRNNEKYIGDQIIRAEDMTIIE